MSTLFQVVFFSLAGGLISLIGGLLLLSSKKRAYRLASYATPFAAGALLAAAFVDLLSEAAHAGVIDTALNYTLIGIIAFFLLERFLRWFHHHHAHDTDNKKDPNVSLIVAGDIAHNLIDGVAIAAGFLVSPGTGIIATIAVAAHEIPQEIGDFGLLLHKGLRRRSVILVNLVSALATTLAAVIFFLLGQGVEIPMGAVLGLVAGFFIYIAVSDIIPTIHKHEEKVLAGPQTIMLIIGAIIVSLTTSILHDYIDPDRGDNSTGSSTVDEHGHEDDEHHDY